jgi:hypothetical protein
MEFPEWVTGPTPCKTRTYSVSLAIDPLDIRVKNKYPTKIVKSLNNDPTVLIRNKETGKLMTVWADLTDPRFELVED